MPSFIYGAIALTGGGVGALDSINGDDLQDKDSAIVFTPTFVYLYSLDAASAATPSSPEIIIPASNAGTKRWKLLTSRGQDVSLSTTNFGGLFSTLTDKTAQNALDTVDNLFSVQKLKLEHGGLGGDISGFTGIIKIVAGVATQVSAPTGAIVGISDQQTLTNKTIDGDDNTLLDIKLSQMKAVIGEANKFILRDNDGIVVAGLVVPSGDVVGTSDSQILTNKTLTSPKVNENVALTSTSTELNQLHSVSVGGTAGADITTNNGTQTLGSKVVEPKVSLKSATGNIAVTEDTIFVDSTSGNITLTLPAATNKRTYKIIKTVAANNVIVQRAGTDTVEGGTSITIKNQYEPLVLTNDGVSLWNRIGSSTMAANDLLTLLKTVDGTGSGLDADTLDGISSAGFATSAQGTLADAALPAASYTANDVLTKIKTVDGTGSGLDSDTLDGLHSTSFATAAQGALADAALPAASYTANDVLTKIKTVDGTGSGLDADTIDGLHSTSFATSAQGTLADNALPKAGGTMIGSITIPTGQKITITDAPAAGTDGANRAYVDSKIAGLVWLSPVELANCIGTATSPVGSPVEADSYIIGTGGNTGAWSTFAVGDLVQYQTSTWVKIKSMAIGDRVGISFISGTTAVGDAAGKDNQVGQISGGTAGAWTWTWTAPLVGQAVYVNNVNALYFGRSFTYTSANTWVEFSGPTAVNAGTGLAYSGNILNVMLGAGITELPSDEVGLDLYSGGGLMTTVDGTVSSTVTGAQLSLTKVGAAGTYKSVTTDAYGRVTSGTNPTTIAGFGITDGVTTADYTAADVLTKIKTVDGTTSGLDADLLDGLNSTDFATSAQGTKADAALPASSFTLPVSLVAGLTISADKLAYYTGINSISLTTLTTAGRALLDDVDAAAQRTTLGLGTIATLAAPSGNVVGTSDVQTLSNKTVEPINSTHSATGNITGTEDTIWADSTSGTIVLTLPTATNKRTIKVIKTVAANLVTLTANGTDTVEGNANISLDAQYESIILVSDGVSTWNKLGSLVTTTGAPVGTTDQQVLTNKVIEPVINTVTSNYTITTSDDVVFGDTTSGAVTLTLPAATNKRMIRIGKVVAVNNLIIDSAGTDTIEGNTEMVLTDQYSTMIVVSDGIATWYLM